MLMVMVMVTVMVMVMVIAMQLSCNDTTAPELPDSAPQNNLSSFISFCLGVSLFIIMHQFFSPHKILLGGKGGLA